MSESHADHDDDDDMIGVPRGLANTNSDTETDDGDEENNNVDDEDDTDTAPSSPVYVAPGSSEREEEVVIPGDFPPDVENEIVVADNDEDNVNININNMGININVSREGDVEIVGEDIAVEIVSETAVIPDTTEDDTDDDDIAEDEEEYPLPVINTATTEEVLGISSDSDTGGTVETAEDTLGAEEADTRSSSPLRLGSPQPGPSGGHQSGQAPGPSTSGVVTSTNLGSGVVRSSRGKRLPWRDPDYNDTSDSEEDEVSNPASVVSPAPTSAVTGVLSASSSSSSLARTGASRGIMSVVLRAEKAVAAARSRGDFNERRFWRQMSSSNDDLGSIEPAVSSASESVPEVRVRPFSSLQSESTNSLQTAVSLSNLPAPVSSFMIHPHGPVSRPRPSSSVPTALPNTTIRRIIPMTVEGRATRRPTSPNNIFGSGASDTFELPLSRSPLRIEPPPPPSSPPRLHIAAPRPPARLRCPHSRSPSPVSPPQSALYSPIQLPTFPPPINPPRFEPGRARAARSPPQLDRIQRDPPIHPDSPSPPATAPRGPRQFIPHIHVPDIMREEERERAIPREGALGLRLRRSREEDYHRLRWDRLSSQSDRQRQEFLTTHVPYTRRADTVDEYRREVDLTERARLTARRSFERATSVLEASAASSQVLPLSGRLRPGYRTSNAEGRRSQDQDMATEFVRDTLEPESRSSPAKRPRIDQESETQYDADIAEALSRSLADQGGSRSVTSASGDQPQPGCSHWTAPPAAPAQVEAEIPAPGAAADPEPAQAQAVEAEAPNYEAMYNSLLAETRRMTQELQSSLECPVCLETIRSAPVKCCRNGHLICNTCVTRAQNCPTCRVPMGVTMNNKCVSHVANRLIDLVPHPCTNKDRGCPVEERLTVLTGHEPECRFRDVRCPVGYCSETVPMSSLATHLSSGPHTFATRACDPSGLLSHTRSIPMPPLQNSGNTTQLMKSFEPVRFTFAGETFYLQTIVSPDRRFLYHFVQMEGSKADCSQFSVKISVMACTNFTSAQASTTTWPITLDQHCRDDLGAIGNAAITQERLMESLVRYDGERGQYQFKVEVQMSKIKNNEQ